VNIQNRQKLSEIIKTARGTMSQRAFGKLLGVSATAGEWSCWPLHRNDLTAENTEDTEGENREMNNLDATGFYMS